MVIFFSDYYGWKVLWRQQSCARKIHTELRRRRFVFLIIEQVLQGAIVSQWANCQWVFWDKRSLTMHFYSIKPWTGTVFVIVGAETLLSYLTYWHTIHDRRAGRKEYLLLYKTAGRKGSSIEVRGRTQGWSFASLATKYLAPHPTKNSVSDPVEVTSTKSTDSFFSCVCDNFINFVLPAKTKD